MGGGILNIFRIFEVCLFLFVAIEEVMIKFGNLYQTNKTDNELNLGFLPRSITLYVVIFWFRI